MSSKSAYKNACENARQMLTKCYQNAHKISVTQRKYHLIPNSQVKRASFFCLMGERDLLPPLP